jgi:hypothetical protein
MLERFVKWDIPHMMPNGVFFSTPFFNSYFSDFMISAPAKYRLGAKLFHYSMQKYFPEEFSLPTTTNWGFGLKKPPFWYPRSRYAKYKNHLDHSINPNIPLLRTQYLDYNHTFRDNKQLSQTIHNNITDLKKRSIINWIDIEKIWALHEGGKAIMLTR